MIEFQVFWTKTAQQDIKRIVEYIASDSRAEARRVFAEIRGKTAGLSNLPLRGGVVPELKFHGILGYREIIRLPWQIVYRVEGDRVYILAVIDSRRNVEDMLLARLIEE